MYLQLRGGVDELPAGSMPGGAPFTLYLCIRICVFVFVYLYLCNCIRCADLSSEGGVDELPAGLMPGGAPPQCTFSTQYDVGTKWKSQ